jgi:hypothetical protein
MAMGPELRRIPAREIIRLQERFHSANNGRDISVSAIEFFDLKYRLADMDPPVDVGEQLRHESEPYSATHYHSLLGSTCPDGRSHVFLGMAPRTSPRPRIGDPSLRENYHELAREFVVIKDRDGKPRSLYRLS